MPAFLHLIDKGEKKFNFKIEGRGTFMADTSEGLEFCSHPLSDDWPQLCICDEFGVWKVLDHSNKGLTINGTAKHIGLLAGGEFITVGKYNLLFEMRFDTEDEREQYEGARRKIDEHSETEAEFELGLQYLRGTDVAQDFAKARALFESADEKHHPDAAYRLDRGSVSDTGT